MGFAKLFEEVAKSSLNEEELHVRWLFVVSLTLANKDGFFRATVPSLARIANISRKQAEDAIAILTGPDPSSTTPDEEGRRLVHVGDGANEWRIVNYQKYRAIQVYEDRLARQRAKRAEDKEAGKETFPEFWKQWPKGRKINRKKSLSIWCGLSEPDRQAALLAIPNHVRLWQEEGRQLTYIPHPTSWLNGRRWEDELEDRGSENNPYLEGEKS